MVLGDVRISVIVPVYNMAGVMRRALDRLAEQTYRCYEVILVDDGSTDDSPAICDEYSAKYSNFRTIHKRNGGLSSARNAGMEVALGEWITFCDPDDLPSTEWLENYDVDNAGDYDLISQGFRTDRKCLGVDKNEDFFSVSFEGSPLEYIETLMEHNALGYTWVKLYRKSIIRTHNLFFDKNIRFKEDEEFLFRYLKHCDKAVNYDKIGYFYFMPDWGRKYRLSVEDHLYFHERVFESLSSICGVGDVYVPYYYMDSLTYELMLAFKRCPKRSYLRKIRQINKDYPKATRMRPYLKKTVIADATMTLSWLMLYLHIKIKNT